MRGMSPQIAFSWTDECKRTGPQVCGLWFNLDFFSKVKCTRRQNAEGVCPMEQLLFCHLLRQLIVVSIQANKQNKCFCVIISW